MIDLNEYRRSRRLRRFKIFLVWIGFAVVAGFVLWFICGWLGILPSQVFYIAALILFAIGWYGIYDGLSYYRFDGPPGQKDRTPTYFALLTIGGLIFMMLARHFVFPEPF